MLSPAAIKAAPQYTISGDGIGKVKIGSKISSLPKQVEGLYDELQVVPPEDEDEAPYYNAVLSGQTVLAIIPYNYMSPNNDYHIWVPVTVKYAWGDYTQYITIKVSRM